ncbi:MAG: DNA repair protein RadC, partial [Planctomycetota bacterium]|nr:DNA repair protein RadC [Planctomycetota bacterium]
REVMEVSSEELQEIKGIGPANIFGIKLAREITQEFLKDKVIKKEFCKSSKDVFNYLYSVMSGLKKEVFKVIFLDGKNRILDIEDLFEGTLNKSAVYPREIMKQAIKNNASALVFVHNHPTGDPEPSQSDKDITKDLVSAGRLMDIKVLDHIIIGNNCYYSFADNKLI